jgi:hypothetical protein
VTRLTTFSNKCSKLQPLSGVAVILAGQQQQCQKSAQRRHSTSRFRATAIHWPYFTLSEQSRRKIRALMEALKNVQTLRKTRIATLSVHPLRADRANVGHRRDAKQSLPGSSETSRCTQCHADGKGSTEGSPPDLRSHRIRGHCLT